MISGGPAWIFFGNDCPLERTAPELILAVSMACGIAALAHASCSTTFGGEIASQANIVLTVADDMGWSNAGCHGGEIKTPNLDRLAREVSGPNRGCRPRRPRDG